MIDVSDVFDSSLMVRIQLRPNLNRYNSDGSANEQTGEPFDIHAIVMPAGITDIQRLPEGERMYPSIKVYSQTAINAGDLVDYGNKTYRVSAVADWSDSGFYNVIAVQHNGTTSPHSASFTVT